MNQSIRLDVNPMMAEYVGPRGIARADLDALVPELKRAHAAVEAGRGKDMQGWMDLPYNQEEVVADIEATAARRSARNSMRSSCSASAAARSARRGGSGALDHLHYNELPPKSAAAEALRRGQHRPRAHGGADGRDRPEQDLLQRHHKVRRHRPKR